MPLQPDEIERQDFTVRLRGFDPDEVRTFLASLADDLRATSPTSDHDPSEDPHELLDEAKHLAAAVVEEAERRAARIEGDARARAEAIEAEAIAATPPAPDAPAPQGDLGEQIAAVLTTANNETESTIRSANAEAERILARAHAEADRIRAEAAPAASPDHDSTTSRPHLHDAAGAGDARDERRRPRAADSGGEERSAVVTEAIRAIVKLVLDVDHGRGADPDPAPQPQPRPRPTAAPPKSAGAAAVDGLAAMPTSPGFDSRTDHTSGDLERELRSEFARRHGPEDGVSPDVLAAHHDRLAEPDPDGEPSPVLDLRDSATGSYRAIGGTPIETTDISTTAPHPPAPDWTQE